MDTNAVNTE